MCLNLYHNVFAAVRFLSIIHLKGVFSGLLWQITAHEQLFCSELEYKGLSENVG